METITIPKNEYENMIRELQILRGGKETGDELYKQFKESLEDVRAGRVTTD